MTRAYEKLKSNSMFADLGISHIVHVPSCIIYFIPPNLSAFFNDKQSVKDLKK